MTEAEWLTYASDPHPMLVLLPMVLPVSDRKLRLFAVACCRRAMQQVEVRPWAVEAVNVAERYADGKASTADLQKQGCYTKSTVEHACNNAAEVEGGITMADCAALNSAWGATQPGTVMPDDGGISQGRLVREQANQCTLLREVFGNPFRTVEFAPAWRTSDAFLLARGIYEERAFDRMPILADALQDAGCDSDDLLSHLRDTNTPHVRGCWALDLVLGKE